MRVKYLAVMLRANDNNNNKKIQFPAAANAAHLK